MKVFTMDSLFVVSAVFLIVELTKTGYNRNLWWCVRIHISVYSNTPTQVSPVQYWYIGMARVSHMRNTNMQGKPQPQLSAWLQKAANTTFYPFLYLTSLKKLSLTCQTKIHLTFSFLHLLLGYPSVTQEW